MVYNPSYSCPTTTHRWLLRPVAAKYRLGDYHHEPQAPLHLGHQPLSNLRAYASAFSHKIWTTEYVVLPARPTQGFRKLNGFGRERAAVLQFGRIADSVGYKIYSKQLSIDFTNLFLPVALPATPHLHDRAISTLETSKVKIVHHGGDINVILEKEEQRFW